MTRWLSAIAVMTAILLGAIKVCAQQELTLIAPNIADNPIQELAKAFEAKTGIKVNATIGAVVASKDRVVHGEPFDVVRFKNANGASSP
jgi:ABC-type molybdate transport system substrate-binding protein